MSVMNKLSPILQFSVGFLSCLLLLELKNYWMTVNPPKNTEFPVPMEPFAGNIAFDLCFALSNQICIVHR